MNGPDDTGTEQDETNRILDEITAVDESGDLYG